MSGKRSSQKVCKATLNGVFVLSAYFMPSQEPIRPITCGPRLRHAPGGPEEEITFPRSHSVWHSDVCPPPERSLFPPATLKERLDDHRTKRKSSGTVQKAPEPAPEAPLGGRPAAEPRPLENSERQWCLNGPCGAQRRRPGDTAEVRGKCASNQCLFLK